jgi:Leucine-rich repeat (LRR) protein
MTEDKTNSLIHRPGSGLTGSVRGSNPILKRMTQDVLARAQDNQMSHARFRIGDYLLRQPDYRQIVYWADELNMTPEALLAVLAETLLEPDDCNFEPVSFSMADGAIVSLAWDLERLGNIPADWEPGLLIRTLGFFGEVSDAHILIRPILSKLKALICYVVGPFFSEESNLLVDLSGVTGLIELHCIGHPIIKIDLSPVSELTKLECSVNYHNEIDLSLVPKLKELVCMYNELTDLDLSSVQGLIKLQCAGNHLKNLNLSTLTELRELDLWNNQLTKLDLSNVSGLTELCCGVNSLTQLDLSPVPGLVWLCCKENQLTELDLSLTPRLTKLYCGRNKLTQLDLSPVPALVELGCDKDVLLLNAPHNLLVSHW